MTTATEITDANRPVYGEPRHGWLDWLRGISVLMVLATHYQVDWWDAGLFQPLAMANMRFGWAGVDFFYLISGFLIGNLLLGEIIRHGTLDAKRFCFRRLLKIWPLYYLCCLTYVLTAPVLQDLSTQRALELILPALLHVQNYIQPLAMGHLGSLAVEEHFYVLLPILITLCYRYSRPTVFARNLLMIIIVGITAVFIVRAATSVVYSYGGMEARGYSHFRMDALFAGVLLAWTYRYARPLWNRLSGNWRLLVVPALAGLSVFAFNPNHSLFVAAIGYSLVQLFFGSILLYASCFDSAAPPRMLQRPLAFLAWIGRHSYPIYLFHPFLWLAGGDTIRGLIEPEAFLVRSVLWLAGFVVFVGLSVGLGAAIGDVLEKPLLAWRNRMFPPRVLALDTPAVRAEPEPADVATPSTAARG